MSRLKRKEGEKKRESWSILNSCVTFSPLALVFFFSVVIQSVQSTSRVGGSCRPDPAGSVSSGKHKIVSSRSNERLDLGSGTKAVMPKKKVIAARNLERLDQVYHHSE